MLVINDKMFINKKSKFSSNLVSIVMPAHNSEKFILESIESIINQTYANWELHVVDDASKDQTTKILKEISESDSRIKVTINEINSGAAVTRNVALAATRGQYVAFLDSDDVWEKNKLEKQIKFMETNMECFTFTSYKIVDESGKENYKIVDAKSKELVGYKDMLAKRATLGCSTVVIDQSIIREKYLENLEMPLIRTGQDYAFWLRILKEGVFAKRINEPLTKYRIVKGSISRNKVKKAKRQWEIYRNLENLDLFQSAWYFLNYALRAIFRS